MTLRLLEEEALDYLFDRSLMSTGSSGMMLKRI